MNVKNYAVRKATAILAMAFFVSVFSFGAPSTFAQNKVMGEVKFEGTTKIEKDAGVWIDGNYVGYLKELKGDKKIMLLPGEHEVIVRQSGYDDFVKKSCGRTRPGPDRKRRAAKEPARHLTRHYRNSKAQH